MADKVKNNVSRMTLAGHRTTRSAMVALRYQQAELPPLNDLKGKEPQKLWVVHLREEHPPAFEDALEWFLLTTIAVTDNQIAEACIRRYRLRWRVEDWHRVPKSGCDTSIQTNRQWCQE
ncbi:MAG: hypothetical protein KDI47_05150 [Gammaproteobacteria bacterium]|nr:hypothetical protein [Gammaproteobacteria bacterium]MCP5407896.1 hypothetical protein [Chromatiaceae bacterium]